ncbi:hypothetical protein BDN70DRAFT_817650 [Pholiota conissans]|uniref:RING-type domain-containing protein n=1 Tax=Pholiota conissans TaxID=109636 RepID=A0A9P5YR68_9AGAR|nr:hypothetical protein BDN70DRAFT_817650 [Pholiota conissans]
MLSIGPDSSCDICFERFGQDLKAAWSIECGHIFCGECIQNIDDPRLCPMCRSPFEHGSCIRLHVDLDLAQGEPSSVDAAALQEARRFKHALASIAETGATEPRLRQLIQDGNNFLNSQPRNSHKDLRNAHRIIAYLYEVKMTSRSQAQVIDTMKEQVTQLRKEKEELEQKLEKQEEIRQYESETAAAVENTLREHCAQAKQAQKAASE